MEDKNYTEEQKTYLVNRLEQGDSLEMMKKYASPSLSVEYMEWMMNQWKRLILFQNMCRKKNFEKLVITN